MKYLKFISLFLGISMFTFGILKFVNPFKTWYAIQISHSQLGNLSYWMGIMGEIVVGLMFVTAIWQMKKISPGILRLLILSASFMVIIMMAVGIYVHFHPNVPEEVLPLKIKPPYIPGFFMVLAFLNILLANKKLYVQQQKKHAGRVAT